MKIAAVLRSPVLWRRVSAPAADLVREIRRYSEHRTRRPRPTAEKPLGKTDDGIFRKNHEDNRNGLRRARSACGRCLSRFTGVRLMPERHRGIRERAFGSARPFVTELGPGVGAGCSEKAASGSFPASDPRMAHMTFLPSRCKEKSPDMSP